MLFDEMDFVAGAACLDFVNTVGGHRGGEADDKLAGYDALVDWAGAGGFLSAAAAKRLKTDAARAPGPAAKTHARAIALREALYGVFFASLRARSPKPGDLETFNREFAGAQAQRRLRRNNDVWRLEWAAIRDHLDAPLWPVAASAADILLSQDVERLAECASETCGWLFLDLSKNGSRRWCDMRVCGNRAKMRRYRA